MWIDLGNNNAVAKTRNPDGSLTVTPVPGEWVTRSEYPESYSINDAINDLLNPQGALEWHFAVGALPAWVDSDTPDLKSRVEAILGIPDNSRPASWGEANQSP